MKKAFKPLALLLALTMALLSFAACGGTGEDPTPTDGADGTTLAEGQKEYTLLDPNQKVLTVGTNPEFPPFEFIGDDGQMDGFDIALINAIAEKMGLTVKMENMEFKALISAIGSRLDIVIAGMTVNEERLKEVDFSDSYFNAVQYVIVAEGDDSIKSAADLKGKKIGVQEGTTGDFIATDDIEDTKVSRFPKAVTAVMDLANGKVDAVIIDKNPAEEFVKTYDNIKIVGQDFFEPEQYAIAVPKNQPELLAAINEGLAAVKADGTFDALLAKYIVGDAEA